MLGKRTLYSWRDEPPDKPTAPLGTALWDSQKADYEAVRWTDSLCKIITSIPVVRGMLDGNPALAGIPISFIENDAENRFAYYDYELNEIVLNAQAIKEFSSQGDLEYSDLQLNCIFSILHELRHGHQYSHQCDPWLKTIKTENPQLVMIYDTWVREADATAFALTGMYELVAYPQILPLADGSFEGIMSRAPESASRDAFVDSIREDVRNFFTGEAQQKAFTAYFSEKNENLASSYADFSIRRAQALGLNYSQGDRISNAFRSAASHEVFTQTYSFLGGMPSLGGDDPATYVERKGYLSPWPLAVNDFLDAVSPAQYERMGFYLG